MVKTFNGYSTNLEIAIKDSCDLISVIEEDIVK
jgi:hypothetical protein